MLAVEDMEFSPPNWLESGSTKGLRKWFNAAGDELTLEFIGVVPDLPAPPSQIDILRRHYRQTLIDIGGLVEVDPISVAGVLAVKAVMKTPQNPTGMTYSAIVTVPFRDCFFVLRWQCAEYGTTGMRDTFVFSRLRPRADPATGEPIGWSQDPYEPSHRARGLRNRSDDPQWDAQFPSHPLSRLRTYLREFEKMVRLSQRAQEEPRFVA